MGKVKAALPMHCFFGSSSGSCCRAGGCASKAVLGRGFARAGLLAARSLMLLAVVLWEFGPCACVHVCVCLQENLATSTASARAAPERVRPFLASFCVGGFLLHALLAPLGSACPLLAWNGVGGATQVPLSLPLPVGLAGSQGFFCY